VSAAFISSQRLRRLEQILAQPVRHGAQGPDADAAAQHTASAALERIRQLSLTIEERAGEPADDIDALATRLLLNDYTFAVAQLRAVARDGGRRVDLAANAIVDVRRSLWREEKLLQQALEEPAAD
jgi:hypothetical protein